MSYRLFDPSPANAITCLGWLNEPNNLMTVCGSGTTGCHGMIHANPEQSYAYGWLVHPWVDDPSTIQVKTWRGMKTLKGNR